MVGVLVKPRSGTSINADLEEADLIDDGALPFEDILFPKLRNLSTTPPDVFLTDLGEPALILLGYCLTFLLVEAEVRKLSSDPGLTGDLVHEASSLDSFSVVFSGLSLISNEGESWDNFEEFGESVEDE
jgi:hypothetical protein